MAQITLFARPANSIRLINSGIPKDDVWILKIQIQKSIFGITYWKTVFETTDYSEAVFMYKGLVMGHPAFFDDVMKESDEKMLNNFEN